MKKDITGPNFDAFGKSLANDLAYLKGLKLFYLPRKTGSYYPPIHIHLISKYI